MISWGGLKPIGCVYEENGFCPRNGAGPPPIKTDKGWLLLYHAVTEFKEEEQEKLQKQQEEEQAFLREQQKQETERQFNMSRQQ